MLNYSNRLALLYALSAAGAVSFTSAGQSPASSSVQSISSVPDSVATPQENIDSILSQFKELDELTVTARKNTIKTDGANVTYDVGADDTSKGKSLLDALRSVPMVSVDGQDNVKIKGDGNFKIYVNGKEDTMLEANYQRVFKAMPASSVKKIEVLTEPGAAYDAEGSGGILNLITEVAQRNDGFAGSLIASLGNAQWMAGATGRMKYSKFSADANVYYAANSFGEMETHQSESRIMYDNADGYRQESELENRMKFNFVNASVNTSWEPNARNLFTFGGSYMRSHADGTTRNGGMMVSMFDINGKPVWKYAMDCATSFAFSSAKANASYQHTFDDAGHRLILAYRFNYGYTPITIDYLQRDIMNFPVTVPFSRLDNDSRNREHTAQLDYQNPFGGDRHKLEAGVKFILRHNTAISHTLTGNSADDAVAGSDDDVNMAQTQNVYAAYSQYTGHFGSFTGVAGLRYEHTLMKTEYRLGTVPGFTSHLNDIVPNVSLSWSPTPMKAVRLAYNMRISRPGIDQLNPYEMRIGNTIRKGNPDLTSMRTNNVSLSYSDFGRIIGGNIGVEYRHTGNSIESFTYFEGDDIISTYANVGNINEVALNGFINIQATQSLSFNAGGRLAHKWLSSKSPRYSNKGWTGNYNASASYTAPGKVRFSLYGGQQIHDVMLQGHSNGWYYYGLSVSRAFLKDDALTLTLNASNFMQKYITYRTTIRTLQGETSNAYRNRQWNVGVTLQWNFGKLNSSTKKTAVEIENNDVSKGATQPGMNTGGMR